MQPFKQSGNNQSGGIIVGVLVDTAIDKIEKFAGTVSLFKTWS